MTLLVQIGMVDTAKLMQRTLWSCPKHTSDKQNDESLCVCVCRMCLEGDETV